MNATTETPKLPALQTGGAIRPIVPVDFEQAWRIGNAVVKAGMAPKGLETAEKCTIAILHGLEVGMTPMAALQSIALINNRATIYGDGALGLCQGSGKMEWHKESKEGTPGQDDYTAYCDVKRLNDPEVKHGKFSIADAKLAGLWKKAGPWTQYPDRMLQMRARSWALRDGFSDVLKGLGIAEEVMDTPMRDVTPEKPPTELAGLDEKAVPNVAGQTPHTQTTAAASEQGVTSDAPPMDLDLGDGKQDPTNRGGAANVAQSTTTTHTATSATSQEAQIPLDGDILGPKKNGPPPKTGNQDEDFLGWVDYRLAKVTKAEDLEGAFDDDIKARMHEISKERLPDVYAVYQKHERRLGID